jgi:MATE family, multidrug efflux pump
VPFSLNRTFGTLFMKDLSKGKEGKLIFQFAAPMLLGNIFQQLYNIIDSVIVGNVVGKEALAAVGASFPIIFALVSLIIGIAMGSTIVIAQYFGAKDMEKVKRAIDTLYIFIFFASIVVAFFGIVFSNEIFALIKLPIEVRPDANLYMRIYLSGILLFFGFNATSAILRGLGDSKTPLYFLIIATIANIIFDIVFVVYLKMGVAGAAIATIIAQGGAFISAILYLNRYHEVINLSWRRLVFDRAIFKKSFKIGYPIGIQQASVALGMMAMFWLVNPFGTSATAAYAVVFRISSFVSMPAMNFAAALSTFVGQNLGANKPHRIKQGLYATLKMVSVLVTVISVLSIIFRNGLMDLFTNDQEVIRLGAEYILIVSGFYIIFSTMFIIGGVMRGAGDTLIPMFITFIALWIVRVPLCYFLSVRMGLEGIWWGIPIAWIVGMTLSYFYYLTGRWKKKAIVKYSN